MRMVHLSTITTQDQLASWLNSLGYTCTPVRQSLLERLPYGISRQPDWVLACQLDDQPNHLPTHVIVAVYDGQCDLFAFEDVNYWFRLRQTLTGVVTPTQLTEAISAAADWTGVEFG